MALLPKLPKAATISDYFETYPAFSGPLLSYINALLRDDGELTIAQREMIAAYVSGLNKSRFCFGTHLSYARMFGMDGDIIDALLFDIETAPVSEELKPLFRYAKKLNEMPTSVNESDAIAVFDAGLSPRALNETIHI